VRRGKKLVLAQKKELWLSDRFFAERRGRFVRERRNRTSISEGGEGKVGIYPNVKGRKGGRSRVGFLNES